MKLYTKTGDKGTTALFGGKRVPKFDLQVHAYGTVDELTSTIGWVIASGLKKKDADILTIIQNDMYKIMSVLSGSTTNLSSLPNSTKLIENRIDAIDETLPPLRNFILPQGGEIAARCHIARTITRRCERILSLLFSEKKYDTVGTTENRTAIMQYINRLSDLFFIMGRLYADKEHIAT